MNGGKNLMRAVGMAGKDGSRHTKACRTGQLQATPPADSPPGTGLEETNGPQLAGLAAKQTAADDVGLPCTWVGGVQECWPSRRRLRPT